MAVTPVIVMVPNQYKYTIRVRVSRLWRPRFNNTDTYDGLHYVLVDEDGDSIHAFINEDQHDDYIKKVHQGQVYEICLFTTHLADPRASRVLHNDMVVHFHGPTEFLKINEAPLIPQQSFQLIEFEDLEMEIERENKEVLTDIYGCIKTVLRQDIYGCIKTVRGQHEQPLQATKKTVTKFEVIVQNLRRKTLKITLWGDIARSFDIETVQRSPSPVLAVFTSLNLGEYDGHVVASNSKHTCCFFNPPIPATDEYMIEFSKTGDNVRIIGAISSHQTTKGVEQPNQVTVSELNALNPINYMEKSVFCSASIRKFSPNGWWYRSCSTTDCYRMLHKNEEKDNKYFCPLHGLQNPQPSYVVRMTIEDEESQVTLTLMGRQAQQLFKNSCQQLLEKRFYPTEQSLPEEIVDTVGQAHLFEIKLKPDHSFTVSGIAPSKDAATTTVDLPQTKRKRTNESGLTTLSIKEPEKKSRRETAKEASSSSSMTPDKTKFDWISI